MSTTVRIAIEVKAGAIPGTPMPEYTKLFIITSDVWYAQGEYDGCEEAARMEILRTYGFAQEYARDLMNPQRVNWVNIEWIFF